MSGFHIRCREPGVPATFEVKASWGDETTLDELQKLLTEAYAAAMLRIDNAKRADARGMAAVRAAIERGGA